MALVLPKSWRGVAKVAKSAFAAPFVLGGVGHFLATDVYLRIMPPYRPYITGRSSS